MKRHKQENQDARPRRRRGQHGRKPETARHPKVEAALKVLRKSRHSR